MKVHFVPRKSVFEDEIHALASDGGDKAYSYEWSKGRFARLISFLKVGGILLLKNDADFHFHWVPHNWLFWYNLFMGRKIILGYWGGDFYPDILPEVKLVRHCVRKSPYLTAFLGVPRREKTSIKRFFRLCVACKVATGSTKIVLLEKHYRYFRYAHFKITRGRKNFPEYIGEPRYGLQAMPSSIEPREARLPCKANSMNVLICHNASESVNVTHTCQVLKVLSQKFALNVYGFLSYSGGDKVDRKKISAEYQKLVGPYAHSVTFYTEFLNLEELDNVLRDIDIAIFSAYRNEGVSILRRYVELGGIVSFNRFSMNYSYFRKTYPNSVVSIDKLLTMESKELERLVGACSSQKEETSSGL